MLFATTSRKTVDHHELGHFFSDSTGSQAEIKWQTVHEDPSRIAVISTFRCQYVSMSHVEKEMSMHSMHSMHGYVMVCGRFVNSLHKQNLEWLGCLNWVPSHDIPFSLWDQFVPKSCHMMSYVALRGRVFALCARFKQVLSVNQQNDFIELTLTSTTSWSTFSRAHTHTMALVIHQNAFQISQAGNKFMKDKSFNLWKL